MHMFIVSDICQQQTVYPSQEGGTKGKDSRKDDREKSHVSIVRDSAINHCDRYITHYWYILCSA
jgi:hypothetical protein